MDVLHGVRRILLLLTYMFHLICPGLPVISGVHPVPPRLMPAYLLFSRVLSFRALSSAPSSRASRRISSDLRYSEELAGVAIS